MPTTEEIRYGPTSNTAAGDTSDPQEPPGGERGVATRGSPRATPCTGRRLRAARGPASNKTPNRVLEERPPVSCAAFFEASPRNHATGAMTRARSAETAAAPAEPSCVFPGALVSGLRF